MTQQSINQLAYSPDLSATDKKKADAMHIVLTGEKPDDPKRKTPCSRGLKSWNGNKQVDQEFSAAGHLQGQFILGELPNNVQDGRQPLLGSVM